MRARLGTFRPPGANRGRDWKRSEFDLSTSRYFRAAAFLLGIAIARLVGVATLQHDIRVCSVLAVFVVEFV